MHRRILVAILVGLLIGVPGIPPGYAQAPVAGDSPPPAALSAAQLEELVGRIALYPDDLVAIVLPAATFPLDIVQADRFLQKLKQDKNLKPDERWDESIRNLLNYPEVISMMSQDLDWTQDLGEAVVSQQGGRPEGHPGLPGQGRVRREPQVRRQAAHRPGEQCHPDRPGRPRGDLRPPVPAEHGGGRPGGAGLRLLPSPIPQLLLPLPSRLRLCRSCHRLRHRRGDGLGVQLGRRPCREQRQHQ